MRTLILTEALAVRIARALTNAAVSRLLHVQRLAGNPLGIEIRRFDRITAHLVRRDVAYYPFFNGPLDVRPGDEDMVPDLAAWYRANDRPCYVRLSPFFTSQALLRRLAAAGLQQSDFRSVLWGVPSSDPPSPSVGIAVQVFQTPDLEPFLGLWTADAPAAERGLRWTLAAAEFARWRCYVAFVGDCPAAHAGLYLDADTGVGVLAAAASRPEFRGRGCQMTLLRTRLVDAAAAGCDLVVAQASPGTTSQRNIERVGLRTAYTEVIWTGLGP